jgi:hypothetical protein
LGFYGEKPIAMIFFKHGNSVSNLDYMSFFLVGYMSFAHFKKTNLKCVGVGFNAHASEPFLSNAQTH